MSLDDVIMGNISLVVQALNNGHQTVLIGWLPSGEKVIIPNVSRNPDELKIFCDLMKSTYAALGVDLYVMAHRGWMLTADVPPDKTPAEVEALLRSQITGSVDLSQHPGKEMAILVGAVTRVDRYALSFKPILEGSEIVSMEKLGQLSPLALSKGGLLSLMEGIDDVPEEARHQMRQVCLAQGVVSGQEALQFIALPTVKH